MALIPKKLIEQKLLNFLYEDIEYGDITGELIPDIPVIANLVQMSMEEEKWFLLLSK